MNTFNDENRIIEYFQSGVKNESVYFPSQTKGAVHAFESIHLESNWIKWTDSSGKAEIPPDFYCDELQLMMEVMRVDDHSYKNRKGKLVNPTLARESKMLKELKDSGILDIVPNARNIFINSKTDLPTNEDHNYIFYLKNFERVIGNHSKNVKAYRKNHPNKKLIFFIMDESSAYLQAESIICAKKERIAGEVFEGAPHYFWEDSDFVQLIKNSDADYVFWYAPYKLIRTIDGMVHLPQVCIYDINALEMETEKYDVNLMMSSEI